MRIPDLYVGRNVTVHIFNGRGTLPRTGTITGISDGGVELAGTWRYVQEHEPRQHRIYIPWTSASYVEVA